MEKIKLMPKCDNCKFSRPVHCGFKKYWERTFKYTTNSKHTTHCDKHEFKKLSSAKKVAKLLRNG